MVSLLQGVLRLIVQIIINRVMHMNFGKDMVELGRYLDK
jgi:hypothetical protein